MRRIGTTLRQTCVRIAALLVCASLVAGQNRPQRDLSQASLEDLMDIQVTSVSKKEQKLTDAAAAIFVITAEDIRRSGVTNLPDVLRMAPGVNVVQINSNSWSINIRGMADKNGDLVLVMIDGLSVYADSYNGVNWDAQDVPLDDIERIEVIRGPGGTVWGANAVNGVINIITKRASDTPGALVTIGGGNTEAQSTVQYGGKAGASGAYRLFASSWDGFSSQSPSAPELSDAWRGVHFGLRSDWTRGDDSFTVQGDLRKALEMVPVSEVLANRDFQQAIFQDTNTVFNANVLGRWKRQLSPTSDFSLQFYYNRDYRLDSGVRGAENTVDFDFQHHLALGSRQDLVWGTGARVIHDDVRAGFSDSYVPSRRTDPLVSAFVQDAIRLSPSWTLTVGTKLEHNNFSGFEYEPSAQLLWSGARQSVWFSAARAIRQPSMVDLALQSYVHSFTMPDGGLGVVLVTGSLNPHHEELRNAEAGYRVQVSKKLSLDFTTFYNDYTNLQTEEPGHSYQVSDPGPARTIFPYSLQNNAFGRSFGAELFATLNVTPRWRISPAYSWIDADTDTLPFSHDVFAQQEARATPSHQFQVRSSMNLTRRLEWDSSFGFVSHLGGSDETIPAYSRLDTRLGWHAGESMEISVVGQNLLSTRHLEFFNAYENMASYVKRSFFGKVTWRF